MRNIIILCLLIFTISCTPEKQNNLSNDKLVKSIFDASEIEELQKIQHFFDQQIGVNDITDEAVVIEAYKKFFNEFSGITKMEEFSIPIDFNQQKEFYSKLSKSTFENIWTFGSITPIDSFETLRDIEFNRNGKYISFLKKVGEQDNTIAEYYNAWETVGDIAPTMVASLIREFNKYNIDDPKIRFVIAIHYLTLNDQLNRKEII